MIPKTLGLSTGWINSRRRVLAKRNKSGFGATPPAQAQPALEVADLHTLAEKMGLI
jgi:hypothetical protein